MSAAQAHCDAIAANLRRVARYATCCGIPTVDRRVIGRGTAVDPVTGVAVIFTRDVGHHTSGWLKNSDYERCLHLSLSPRGDGGLTTAVRLLWLHAFFTPDQLRVALYEGPKSDGGKRFGVEHWRVFCDASWAAIKPRGEVYDTANTPALWRSASQVLAEDGVLIESVLGVDP